MMRATYKEKTRETHEINTFRSPFFTETSRCIPIIRSMKEILVGLGLVAAAFFLYQMLRGIYEEWKNGGV